MRRVKRKIRQVFNALLLLTDLLHTRRDSKSATDMGATPHRGARFLSVEKEIDEIGILQKEGYKVSTRDFIRIGIPFTLIAALSGAIVIWLIWA